MLIREMETLPGDVILTPGDLHFDKQDDRAIALMCQVARAFRVNTCVLIGDTFDSHGISRHGRPTRAFRFGKGTIKAEAAAAAPFFREIESIVAANRGEPGGLYCLTGNHEKWWKLVQDDYPGLLDTPWYELYGPLFDGWHVFKEYTALKFGPLLICHGHRLRGALAKYSAASVLANYPGQNTLYGHTHRVDSCTIPTFKYGMPVEHGAWTIGHMRDIRTELKDEFSGPLAERHAQGFAITHFFEVGGELRFDVNVIPVRRDGRGNPYCVAGGVLFEG